MKRVTKRRYTRKTIDLAITLGDWILGEAAKRKMSVRAFAEYVGVSPSTLNTYTSAKDTEPSLGILAKLAKGTNTPLAILLAIAFPDTPIDVGGIDPAVLLIARELNDIPEPFRDIIKALIRAQHDLRGNDKPTQ